LANLSLDTIKLGADMRRKWDFFIAHAGGDTRVAEILYEFLLPHSRVFLDSKSLILGDNWNQELPNAQKLSLITVVIISQRTENAYYEKEEIAAAIQMARNNKLKHRIIPVFLSGYNEIDVPYGLISKHSLVLSSDAELQSAAEKLLEALTKTLKLRRSETRINHNKSGNSSAEALQILSDFKEFLNAQQIIFDQARITPKECDKIVEKLSLIRVDLRRLLGSNPPQSIASYFVLLYRLDETTIELTDLFNKFRPISTETSTDAENARQYISLCIQKIIKDIELLYSKIKA